MKKNMLIATLFFTAGSFATHVTAGPCDDGIALVNPLTGMVEINGVDIGNGTIVDTKFEIDGDGFLALRDLTTGRVANPSNRFNAVTSQVELDCVVFNENTYQSTLNLIQDGNGAKLEIASLGNVFDASLTQDWTVDYSNSFANDSLKLDASGSATLATFPGTYVIELTQILIDLGLSTLTGTVGIGQFSGDFSHFGENGTFVATPSSLSQFAALNNDRFQVEVDWESATESGKGEAISATDDSAAFFFSDRSNVETLVRVLDGCELNDHYWVFAGGATSVEYTLTVTDTSTGAEKIYNAPASSPAIADTSAFATCP